jgi:hypothetical protein
MSGGSWNYMYRTLEEVADRLMSDKKPLRRAFGEHVAKVANALHDVEWVDSGDSAENDELPSIKAVLGENAKALEIEIVKDDARKIIEQLERLLNEDQV